MKILKVTGSRIKPYIDELAQLRIKIFREYPYLYDGDLDYEARYLANYATYDTNLCVLVVDNNRIVGAATAMWLQHADKPFRECFQKKNINIEDKYYFGEGLLLQDCRGRGLGRVFFNMLESQALYFGAKETTFCSIERKNIITNLESKNKPEYLWKKLGYKPDSDLIAYYRWKELDEEAESEKPMRFWLKKWHLDEI